MITTVGIGPWGRQEMTLGAIEAIGSAECLFGSERQLEAVESCRSLQTKAYKDLKDLTCQLEDHFGKNFVVLASGDPSFYGIAKYLCQTFGKDQVKIISGISSVQYLFAKVQLDMNDVYMTSGHGRPLNMDKVMGMEKTAILTDEKMGPYQIAEKVLNYGEDPVFVIGEALGFEEEKITVVKASQVEDRPYEINVVILDRREGGGSQ